MENNSQSNPQVSTPSTHSEGKVLMIAVLMFIFGGVMGNMIPDMSGSLQKGMAIDSQDKSFFESQESSDSKLYKSDSVENESVVEMKEFPTVVLGNDGERFYTIGSLGASGVIDRPYTCTDLNGNQSSVDINSNLNWLVWVDLNGNVIGSCVPTN